MNRLIPAALGFTLCAPLLAGTVGEIFGSVSDSAFQRIPNVSVVAAGPNLQGARSTVTNGSGEYRFPLLPPGAYRLEFQLAGFQRAVHDDVIVTDPTKASLQQNYKEDFVQHAAVGLQGRTYVNVLFQIPGVTPEGYVLGAHPSQNVFTTDGLNVTEPINHNQPPNIPFDAIEEIEI